MLSAKSLGLDSSIIIKKSTFKNLKTPEKVFEAIKKNSSVINSYAKNNDIKIRGSFTRIDNGKDTILQDAILFTLSSKTKHHKVNEVLEKLNLFHCHKIRAKARDIFNLENNNCISETLQRGESELNYSKLCQRKYV